VARIAHTVLDSAEHYVCQIRSGTHVVTADEPVALGGTDAGPSPYQLGTIHVDVELHKESQEDTGKIKRVISFSESLGDEQRAKLLEISEKTPVTRTIKAGAPITTELG